MEEKRKSELEWLKNRLKNISPINRTLCLARLPKNRVFALSNLDEFEEFKSYELLTKLLDGERSLRLAPVSAPQEQFTESDEPPVNRPYSVIHVHLRSSLHFRHFQK